MIKVQLEKDLQKAISKLGLKTTDIFISIPENPKFGDYFTNVALQLTKQKQGKSEQPASPSAKRGESPMDVANQILKELGHPTYLERVEVAGGGFINFFIKDEILLESVILDPASPEKNLKNRSFSPSGARAQDDKKKYLIEYGHVNPLKEIHIGHLRTFFLGESLSRILESLGNKVFRANYQGDIGLHIAKAIWGIEKLGLPKGELSHEEKAKFLGQSYAQGNKAYDEDKEAKVEIDDLNNRLYAKDQNLMEIYQLAREWSLAYFEPVYNLFGIKYDHCFFESEVELEGRQLVLANVGKVFEEDKGAIIFPGEKYGLHNRVFITAAGNPTYEAKETGLAKLEFDTFNYDKSIHIVGAEQEGYFRVVFKAVEMLFPHLKGKKFHLSYGMVDIKEGKMSSRSGEVITVDDILNMVIDRVKDIMRENRLKVDEEVAKVVALGAIKFAYLKYSPKTNVIFDLEKSVSLQGDSGPYLQYTHARANSVLEQSKYSGDKELNPQGINLELEEREILRLTEYYDSIIAQAGKELKPNLIGEYLLNLAKAFNLFYTKFPIIKSEKSNLRLAITAKVVETIRSGLDLLGINAPKKM
ncbi:arginine--tRNA ligase [Candidatus Daviesbacteria bacterium]|nr:arginine--tRNA ligase [Candidatus Daviesbacteria bacterium]